MVMLITGKQLKLVVPTLTDERAEKLADSMNTQCPFYGINTKDIFHEFLANVAHESGGFSLKDENMNYSAKRLMEVWPSRFKSIEKAKPYERNPKALANLVYGGRMGNRIGTDDGWNFRGSGFIGITGRYVYEAYRKWTEFDNLEKLAEAVRTDDYYALDSACWVFSVEMNLNKAAADDKWLEIVKRINGGTIGLEDRSKYYERAKQYVV